MNGVRRFAPGTPAAPHIQALCVNVQILMFRSVLSRETTKSFVELAIKDLSFPCANPESSYFQRVYPANIFRAASELCQHKHLGLRFPACFSHFSWGWRLNIVVCSLYNASINIFTFSMSAQLASGSVLMFFVQRQQNFCISRQQRFPVAARSVPNINKT